MTESVLEETDSIPDRRVHRLDELKEGDVVEFRNNGYAGRPYIVSQKGGVFDSSLSILFSPLYEPKTPDYGVVNCSWAFNGCLNRQIIRVPDGRYNGWKYIAKKEIKKVGDKSL